MGEFRVQRRRRSYVRPSSPTPSGSMELSAIDRDEGLRRMVHSLHVFPPQQQHHQGDEGLCDGRQGQPQELSPGSVIREALGKALVDYYPLAGRLVDGPEGPVSARVECTGEGAWFVEADAECSLDDVACLDMHPFLISDDDLLPDAAPGVRQIDIPLMMQVTEFTCGGFVVGLSSSHTITDGLGAGQFINAVADYARGLPRPRVTPVWNRELVPSPPKLNTGPPPYTRLFQFRYLTVDLSSDSINAIKSQFLASTGQRCSTFDVAVAKLWQARTRSLRMPSARVTLRFFGNVRHLLPAAAGGDGAGAPGFYGNCFYPVTLTAEARAVEPADVTRVVAMVRDGKARLATEFARWAAGELEDDPFALRFTYESLFVVDWTRLGFTEADYGWGAPSHVVALASVACMPVARIVAPPKPRTGARITTYCVEDEHMPVFREEMKALEK